VIISIASFSFLTTEAVVADKPEPAGAGGMGMPDMGGMGGNGSHLANIEDL
jgi:chaperonin GroEL